MPTVTRPPEHPQARAARLRRDQPDRVRALACANSSAHWRGALAQATRPDVRVVCIQTDAESVAPLSLEGLPASLAVPLPPSGWIGALPAVPATLVLDENGVLVRVWYGEVDAGIAQELAHTIAGLSAMAPRPSR